jgi:hypothetical protein
MHIPLFNTGFVFGVDNSRQYIEDSVRKFAKQGPEESQEAPKRRIEQFISSMCEIVKNDSYLMGKVAEMEKQAGSKISMWTGLNFNFPVPRYDPRGEVSCAYMYNVIEWCRKTRGGETGIRTETNRGYYFGYVPTALYRGYYVTADIMRVGMAIDTKYLEIEKLGGIFTSVVIESLVANGWSIRVLSEFGLPSSEEKIPKKGVYRRCYFPKQYVRWVVVDDKNPVIRNDRVEKKEGVLEALQGYIKDADKVSGCVLCTTVYLRDEMHVIADHLLPSVHAHTGQVTFCSARLKEPLSFLDFIRRVIAANECKNMYVYNRQHFIAQDPYAVKFPVRICQKQVLDTKTMFDFNTNVAEYKPSRTVPVEYVFASDALSHVIIESKEKEFESLIRERSADDKLKELMSEHKAKEQALAAQMVAIVPDRQSSNLTGDDVISETDFVDDEGDPDIGDDKKPGDFSVT